MGGPCSRRGPRGKARSAVPGPTRNTEAWLFCKTGSAWPRHPLGLAVTLGGRPACLPGWGATSSCTLQDTLQAGSVCLSEKGQRHYLLERPRACPGAQAPARGGASFGGGAAGQTELQASSFLRGLAPAKSGHARGSPHPKCWPPQGLGGQEEGRGTGKGAEYILEQDLVFQQTLLFPLSQGLRIQGGEIPTWALPPRFLTKGHARGMAVPGLGNPGWENGTDTPGAWAPEPHRPGFASSPTAD